MRMVEVLELQQGLTAISSLALPVRVAYCLAKSMERVEVEGRRFDGLRRAIFERHGVKDGDRIVVPAEKRAAFNEEMNELLMLESELVVEPFLTIEQLGDAKVAAADLVRCRAILAPEQQGNESRGER